jgi:hypothetical protein
MAFKVTTSKDYWSGGVQTLEFGDQDTFEFAVGGVLKIGRGEKTNLYLNPSQWVTVEETPRPDRPEPQIHASWADHRDIEFDE